ncbi:MAG TPA: FAD-dependent oxidoreductase [Streptosporangiaceae bacterium]|nr:FAD-dependent oxidoreductase [Streptosporangiaceae bacterium]
MTDFLGQPDTADDSSAGTSGTARSGAYARTVPPQGQPRRDFLFASGTAGAALIASRLLGPANRGDAVARAATSARPVWLQRPGTTPSEADWRALRSAISTHKLIRPGQSGYDFAKELFSPQFDSLSPAGVAYCKQNADVAACVNFASKFSLPVRARSGGHSYGGWSSVTGGLIIDVSEMNSMKFGTNTVTVGTGVDLINFYAGLAAHGKAVPGGSCPTVGIAGLTLGGGVGVLSRIYGLTSDNLQSLDIVTADGSTLTCNHGSNRGLYWASRGGGGGNYGVATSFTFGTHNLTSLVLFGLSWPWSQARKVVSAWQSWAPHEPDALWSNLHLSANFGGAPSIGVGGSFVGSVAGAHTELDKLYHLVGTGPSRSVVGENSYLNAMLIEAGCTSVSGCDTPPGGSLPRVPFFAKSDFFSKPLDSAGVSALLSGIERLQHISGAAGGGGSIAFDALGGAVNRVKPTDTAFVHRTSLFLAQYYTSWNWPGSSTGVASQRAWIDSYYSAVHPHANGEAYQNYPDPTLTNFAEAYYGANYPRLSQLKKQYDPKQLFNFPQAIQPPMSVACGIDGATTGPDC